MYNSQYYTCEQIDERLLQGYLDDYNTQTGQSLTKAQFLTKLGNIFSKEGVIDNTATQIGYYECDTAAGTAAKVITVANYALFVGGSIKVKFANKNTANNATLNINSQGAKALYYQGERASATNSWDAEEVVEIYYDGTSYYANNVKGGSGSGVYDVSKEHPTSGPNSDGKFTLEYILNSSNVNELIPVNKRYPGMSIQFVSTSDNNYVQYRLLRQTFSITEYDWRIEEDLGKVAVPCLYGSPIAITSREGDISVTIPVNTAIFYGLGSYVCSTETTISKTKSELGSTKQGRLVFDTVTQTFDIKRRSHVLSNTQVIVFSYSLVTESCSLDAFMYTWNGKYKTLHGYDDLSRESCIITMEEPISISYISPIINIVIPGNTRIRIGSYNIVVSEDIVITANRNTELSYTNSQVVIYNNLTNTYGIKKATYDLIDGDCILFCISLTSKTASLPQESYVWEGKNPIIPNIVAINDKDALTEKLLQLNTLSNDVKPVNILHFSDVHGWQTALQRVVDFKNYYSAYIDDILHTGDTVRAVWDDGKAFWDNVEGSEYILNCIGNHETSDRVDGHPTPRLHTDAECYAQYFADYISNWGVTYEANKCYYYKDYTAQNLRLIVLNDNIYDDSTQLSWLETVLEDARQNNLTVICAAHSRKGGAINSKLMKPNNTMSSFSRYVGSPEGMYNYGEACLKVQAFINAGGTFVCWLLGHAHCTEAGYNNNFTDQLQIFADVAYPARELDNVNRTLGNNSEDSFNIVSIDTERGLLRLIKVGTNYDLFMRKRDSLCYDYINRRLIIDGGETFY